MGRMPQMDIGRSTKPGAYIPTPVTVGSGVGHHEAVRFRQRRHNSGLAVRPALTAKNGLPITTRSGSMGQDRAAERSPQQTETARFWLAVGPAPYHQLPRQLVISQKMSVVDSARFMALYAIAVNRRLRGGVRRQVSL